MNKKGNVLLVILAVAGILTVSVGGYFWLQRHQVQKEKSVSQESSSAKTADWKTYINYELGFSLKYPNTWNQGVEKTVDGNVVVLTPAPVESIGYQIQAVYVKVVGNLKHFTSLEYYNRVLKPYQAGSVCTNPLINTKVPSPLKNLDVTIIEGMCGVLSQGPRMVVTKGNYVVDVSSSFIDKVDNNLIYQILSTFKFINNSGESNVKTDCEKKGGTLIRSLRNPSGVELCQIEYKDADRDCADGSTCQSQKCLSIDKKVPGKCSKYEILFGCQSFVQNGKVIPPLCNE